MQYMGGKQRIAPQLAAFMQPYVDKYGIYVEPFVGSAAVMKKIKAAKRLGSDINEALITMWNALKSGWIPPDNVTPEEHKQKKVNPDPLDPATAFIKFGCSFGGDWNGGYARHKRGDDSSNLAGTAKRAVLKDISILKDVEWMCRDYRELTYPENSVIYCDPPYAGTTEYATTGFDSDEFWQFCRDMSVNHWVFASEYNAPPDFRAVLEIPTRTSLRDSNKHFFQRTEKLWEYRGETGLI